MPDGIPADVTTPRPDEGTAESAPRFADEAFDRRGGRHLEEQQPLGEVASTDPIAATGDQADAVEPPAGGTVDSSPSN